MKIKTQRFKVGDRVIVNTGGTDCSGRVTWNRPPNSLQGCYLIAFDTGHPQWIGTEHLRGVREDSFPAPNPRSSPTKPVRLCPECGGVLTYDPQCQISVPQPDGSRFVKIGKAVLCNGCEYCAETTHELA